MGGGCLAEGRRQKAARIAEIAEIAVIARDRKTKIHHGGTETLRTAKGSRA